MTVSAGKIQSLAKRVAKPAMECMLKDLAKGIRARANQRLSNSESAVALSAVAAEIESIDVSKYFS